MSLLTVLLVLIAVGIIVWVINAYLPVDPKFKRIINVVAIVFVVIWLMKALGLFDALSNVRI